MTNQDLPACIRANLVSSAWMAEQRVTLCYIVKDSRVLLMRKKRGIGAGKINGPGGKVDPGETSLAAAVRETQEEIGVTPLQPRLRGELRFRFRGGPTLHCLIYLSHDFSGDPCETPEALPLWFPLDALPYDEMWNDDRHWLPLLLAGKCFRGAAEVEGDHTFNEHIEVLAEEDFLRSHG
jgi:8-oxo-dGTP diphosphatase